MRKAFSKNLAQSALIALVISSLPAQAAYNDDADCTAVSAGARAGAVKAKEKIDAASATIATAIDSAKNCVDTLNQALTRQISDSSFSDFIPESIRGALASKGCQLLSKAQTEITNRAQSGVNSVISEVPAFAQPLLTNGAVAATAAGTSLARSQTTSQIGSSPPPAAAAAPPASIFQRLANIF